MALKSIQALAEKLHNQLPTVLPPIAVSFVDDRYSGARFEGQAPAGCHFWSQAAQSTFVTEASDHDLCAIGLHTHNMETPNKAGELQDSLAVMQQQGYVREEEIPQIPVLNIRPQRVLYGPLQETAVMPDVVLLFVNMPQALILSEATPRVDKQLAPALGRPACAVIPQVVNNQQAAFSFGCCGARTYIGALDSGVALCALPGSRLLEYGEEILTLTAANKVLSVFHNKRQKSVAQGQRPRVADTLKQMQ